MATDIPILRPDLATSLWLDANDFGRLPGWIKGSYILLFELDTDRTLAAGSLPEGFFPVGYYAYVGSAMKGIRSRLVRHHQANKKRHWHIDYLLTGHEVKGAVIQDGKERLECAAAERLADEFMSVPGFGCSDCRCRSHLFHAPNEQYLRDRAQAALS